jgi:hypothetical protein
MPLNTSRVLAMLALVLSLLSAVTVTPLWIPMMLLSLSVLIREGVRV